MRAALIPPRGYFNTALRSDYHLVLPQVSFDRYEHLYSNLVDEEDFVILDNGAAEGQLVTDDVLINAMYAYGANEVVVPDVLRDMKATVAYATKFLQKFYLPSFTKPMLVVQGRTLEEVFHCIDVFCETWPKATLGIPRHLLETLHDSSARAHVLTYIENNWGHWTVHLRGTHPKHPAEIKTLAEAFSWVRGVDTSMPYNFTIAGELLTEASPGVARPKDYFDKVHVLDGELLDRNIKTYLGWASGTKGTRS